MTALEIILGYFLLVTLSAFWWTYRFMRLHRDDAAFYKELWREIATDAHVIRALGSRRAHASPNAPQDTQETRLRDTGDSGRQDSPVTGG